MARKADTAYEPTWMRDYIATTQREDATMKAALDQLVSCDVHIKMFYDKDTQRWTVEAHDEKQTAGHASAAKLADAIGSARNRYIEAWQERKKREERGAA